MTKERKYKPTLFDRHGPAASDYVRAWGYGFMVFGLTSGVLIVRLGFSWWTIPVGVLAGVAAAGTSLAIVHAAGSTWKHLMMDGSSTPYAEQYSYQQALVMLGRLDQALESFEAVIKEKPNAVDARIRAAELYAREKGDNARAAALFREAQQIATISPGEDIYVSNRLVDLLAGPLQQSGRALVELRRLIERHPGTAAADHARVALAALKTRHFASENGVK
jgi:tetratricopeptide (TPR) repeat protein